MTARDRTDVWKRDYGRDEFPDPFDIMAFAREYDMNRENGVFFSGDELKAPSLYAALEVRLRSLGFSYMADGSLAVFDVMQMFQQWRDGMPTELFGRLEDPESGWEPSIFVPKIRMLIVRNGQCEKIYFRAQVKGDPLFVEEMVAYIDSGTVFDPEQGTEMLRSLCMLKLSDLTIMFFQRCRMYTDLRVLLLAPENITPESW